MQANAINFQYNLPFGSNWLYGSNLINQTIIKQHNHQSISELEFQIHNFDTYTKIVFLMPIHNNRPYLILVLTPVNWKYIEISLSKLEYKF